MSESKRTKIIRRQIRMSGTKEEKVHYAGLLIKEHWYSPVSPVISPVIPTTVEIENEFFRPSGRWFTLS